MSRAHGRRQRGMILLPVVIALTLIAIVAVLINRESGMSVSLAARGLQADAARYVAEAGLAQLNYRVQIANCSGYPALSNVAFGNDSFSGTATPTSGTPVTLNVTATTASGARATLTRTNVVAHQTTPYVMTLQPGPSGMDAYIESSSTTKNYGGADEIRIEGGGQRRGLIRFALGAIPANAVIQSAQMMVYKKSGSAGPAGATIDAYRLTRSWTEGVQDGGALPLGANWNTYDGLAAWTTGGGDYDASAVSASATSGSNGWMTWDITDFVANWVSGAAANYGMVLNASSGVPHTKFYSGDDAGHAAEWPKLVVTFLPPCGWVPVTSATLPPAADARLDEENPTFNYGASTTVRVQGGASPERDRTVMKFDLSSVPEGSRFTSATLRMYVSSLNLLGSSTLYVFRVTESWAEGSKDGTSAGADGATWTKRDSVNNWTTPGGTLDASPSASTNLGILFLFGWVEWDVTALAQAWLDGVSANHGLLVRGSTNQQYYFNSREDALNQPRLVLNW